jgi:hypothetical protein
MRLLVPQAAMLSALAAISLAQPASQFYGTWVLRINGQSIIKLTIATADGRTTGSLTKPGQVDFSDGEISHITPDHVTLPIQRASRKSGDLELTVDGDRMIMALKDADHASLTFPGMPAWNFERASDPGAVILATALSEPQYPDDIRALREHLEAMVKADQNTRFAFDDAKMEAVDSANRSEVLRIFDKYGWVTNSLAGKAAAHNFWLLVQHQAPEIQRRLLPDLEKAAKAGNASMSDYAYLYDRVQVGLGKPQHWGSQVSCKAGKPVLDPVDDPAGLDARRKELFMSPIRKYLSNSYLIEACAKSANTRK